jgi:hypothetical protein
MATDKQRRRCIFTSAGDKNNIRLWLVGAVALKPPAEPSRKIGSMPIVYVKPRQEHRIIFGRNGSPYGRAGALKPSFADGRSGGIIEFPVRISECVDRPPMSSPQTARPRSILAR